MSDEAATATFAPEIKTLGDQIADLTLKQAKELSDYLKDEYAIEPAAGGAVMMAGPAADAAEEDVVKTEFDVVLTGFGDKKLAVVKIVKAMTGCTLMEAKKMVEGVPTTLKEGAPTEDAEKMKKELEEAGAACELK